MILGFCKKCWGIYFARFDSLRNKLEPHVFESALAVLLLTTILIPLLETSDVGVLFLSLIYLSFLSHFFFMKEKSTIVVHKIFVLTSSIIFISLGILYLVLIFTDIRPSSPSIPIWILVVSFVFLISNIIFLSTVLIVLTTSLFKADQITLREIAAAINLFWITAMIFSFFFLIALYYDESALVQFGDPLFSSKFPGNHPTSTILYFCIVTQTSLGFGDIYPSSPFLRSLVSLEALFGQFFLATLVSRLVGKLDFDISMASEYLEQGLKQKMVDIEMKELSTHGRNSAASSSLESSKSENSFNGTPNPRPNSLEVPDTSMNKASEDSLDDKDLSTLDESPPVESELEKIASFLNIGSEDPMKNMVKTRETNTFLAIFITIFLILLILFLPVFEPIEFGSIFISAIYFVIILCCLKLAKPSRRLQYATILLIILQGIFGLIIFFTDGYFASGELAVYFMLFGLSNTLMLLISGFSIVYSLYKEKVYSGQILTTLSVYLILGISFAFIYSVIEVFSPGSVVYDGKSVFDPTISAPRSLIAYYSFITMSTLGYGDVLPSSGFVRMITIIHATVGIFFLAIIIARFVNIISNLEDTIKIVDNKDHIKKTLETLNGHKNSQKSTEVPSRSIPPVVIEEFSQVPGEVMLSDRCIPTLEFLPPPPPIQLD